MDKAAITNVDKTAVVEQLQMTIEWEKMLQEEISHVTIELQSTRAESELAS